MAAAPSPRLYRFGLFEAHPATGELRRQGVRVKLNAQPFQVLCLLLDRPGDLLTREEISRELWPDGTFVDFDHGVNSAVNRIREALGDTAINPRFVETLARRGYRFVAPVERVALEQTLSPPTPQPAVFQSSKPATSGEASTSLLSGILASPDDLPRTSYPVVQTLFILLQLMYMAFYVGGLANLEEIEDLLSVLPHAAQIYMTMILTAGIMVPVRAFVLSMVLFHAPRVREKFLKLWPLACTALLVYSPFAQRSLILMGAGGPNPSQTPSS
jgi:cholera toxin transcriptional activator